MMKTFNIVVAVTTNNFGIGKNGSIPWKIPEDLLQFKNLTTGHGKIVNNQTLSIKNAVIMGRKTWDSLPSKSKPLPGRLNVVLSRQSMELNTNDSVVHFDSFDKALNELSNNIIFKETIDKIFVIGGAEIYLEAMQSNLCEKIFVTEVEANISEMDTYFPTIHANKFKQVERSQTFFSNGTPYRFTAYQSISDKLFVAKELSCNTTNNEELQYLNIVKDIIDNGNMRGDRTGTGTLSKFGIQMRFNLRDNCFPLLTTKKVFWRGVVEELLWFIRGSTNGKELSDKGVHIWDGNGSKEFLISRGLNERDEGDLGPVYGFQWRHFGAQYDNMHTDYSNKGIDQLKECIQKIKSQPEDRRIILTAWNPSDLHLMALPPCHMFCQFYVANGELSCQMYQRSGDMGLGIPFNIASYSLLTVMMAQVCGLKAGDFVHSIGDGHVYLNHVDGLREQLCRSPRPFPHLHINSNVKEIDGFQFSDFSLDGYDPYPTIKMKMAV